MLDFSKQERLVVEFCAQNAHKMFREPTDALKYPYVDPGGWYGMNLWDWDSYWAGRSLIAVARCMQTYDAEFLQKTDFLAETARHIKGSVLNFFDMQDDDGFVPIMTTADGVLERELRRMKKEGCVNQHKPFLAASALQAAHFSKDFGWLKEKLPRLEKYFAFYKANQYHEPTGLYVFNNDVMIGTDNDPVVFGRPARSGASLFLNGFMISELSAMESILNELALPERAAYYRAEKEKLAKSIETYCYDEKDAFYYGLDVQVTTHRSEHFHHGMGAFWNALPVKIRSFLGFLPLSVGIADWQRAARLVEENYFDERMVAAYGVRTLASNEKMYSLELSNNPSNWLGPVWGIANYLVFDGLCKYGFFKEALEMKNKTVALFAADILENGALSESYHPDTGKPMLYGGFLNWNLLVVEMIERCHSDENRR